MQKNNTTKIEAQGGEIITRNSYGDVAIIPKNLVKKYQAYMKAACDECIDELVASLPAMSQYAADGTVIPQGKKVKVTLPDGEQAEYSTDSVEYKNLYNSGKLANVVKDKVTGEDTYVMPALKEVEIVGKATGAARDMIDTKKSYTKEQYIKEKLPAFAGSLGVTADNLGGNAEGYKRAINTKVAENILKRKPNAKEKDLTLYELEIINNSDLDYKIRANLGERFEQGVLSVGNAGSPVKFKSPNLTGAQAERESTPLNMLAPLEVFPKTVRKLIGDDDRPNVLKDIALDPLNLLGLGFIDDLPKLGKAANALNKERQVLGLTDDLPKLEAVVKYDNELINTEKLINPSTGKFKNMKITSPKQSRINKKVEDVLEERLIADTKKPIRKTPYEHSSESFLNSADRELYKLIEATRTNIALSPAEKQLRMMRYRSLTKEGRVRLGEYHPEEAFDRLGGMILERDAYEHASYYPERNKVVLNNDIRNESQVASHEIRHGIQYPYETAPGAESGIDNSISKLKLKDFETLQAETPDEIVSKNYNMKISGSSKETAMDVDNLMNRQKIAAEKYFRTNTREPHAFMGELQAWAIEHKFLLHEYEQITPKIVERMVKEAKLDPQKALRILGIGEESADNYKLIADNFNKLLGIGGTAIIGGSTLKAQLNNSKSKRKQ